MVARRKPATPPPRIEVDLSIAQRDAAIRELRAVLGLFDRKGYMSPEHQHILRAADALVAESERW